MIRERTASTVQPKPKIICAVLVSAVLLACPTVVGADAPANAVYSHKENDKMMIALTFDDGPHPRYTPQILDILAEYGVPATFFTVGENAEYYPAVIKRCLDEGHEVANHTYSHQDLSSDSYEDICREITGGENAVYENLDVRTKLLRPPGGLYGKNLILAAAELDYTVVLWNIDTRDWAHTPPDKIAEKVLTAIRPGDIVLMHDFIGKDSPTPEALRKIIPRLISKGYRFVTVSELLGCK